MCSIYLLLVLPIAIVHPLCSRSSRFEVQRMIPKLSRTLQCQRYPIYVLLWKKKKFQNPPDHKKGKDKSFRRTLIEYNKEISPDANLWGPSHETSRKRVCLKKNYSCRRSTVSKYPPPPLHMVPCYEILKLSTIFVKVQTSNSLTSNCLMLTKKKTEYFEIK